MASQLIAIHGMQTRLHRGGRSSRFRSTESRRGDRWTTHPSQPGGRCLLPRRRVVVVLVSSRRHRLEPRSFTSPRCFHGDDRLESLGACGFSRGVARLLSSVVVWAGPPTQRHRCVAGVMRGTVWCDGVHVLSWCNPSVHDPDVWPQPQRRRWGVSLG